ncbi:MAG: hypothetical protein JSR53_12965 [Proteobacteria bacterium]|nr:hypothetical protein [Pseudomonadota bacterium]
MIEPLSAWAGAHAGRMEINARMRLVRLDILRRSLRLRRAALVLRHAPD